MPKSRAEIERLTINAKAQQILIQGLIKQTPKNEVSSINQDQSKDVFQPKGDIDYSKFNKASKAKK